MLASKSLMTRSVYFGRHHTRILSFVLVFMKIMSSFFCQIKCLLSICNITWFIVLQSLNFVSKPGNSWPFRQFLNACFWVARGSVSYYDRHYTTMFFFCLGFYEKNVLWVFVTRLIVLQSLNFVCNQATHGLILYLNFEIQAKQVVHAVFFCVITN